MKKMDTNGATWDSLFLTFAKALTVLFSFAISKIMSIGLSLTEYGTYSQVNLIVSMGSSLILLGFGDGINYYFNRKNKEGRDLRIKIINTIFFLELVAGIILSLIIIIFREWVASYFSNNLLHSLLVVAAPLPVFANLISFYQIMYVSSGKAKLMSLCNLVLMALKIISVYIAVYVLHDILWIFVVLLVLDLIQILVFNAILARKDIRITPFKISVKHIRPILAYSLPMGVYALTNMLNRDIDKLVIGRLAGTEALAIYTNCSKILPFDFLATSFATVLIPYIVKFVTEKDKAQTIKLFSSYIKIGYYSVWILGAAVLIAPESIIRLLYAEEYTVGLNIFVIYVIDSMLRFASMHLILTAANKTRKLMSFSLLSLGLNLILNILFYYLFGMIGPAIATLIVSIVYTLLVLSETIRTINIQWKDVFNIKEVSCLLISLGILGIGARGLNSVFILEGMNRYLSMILSMFLFGCVCLALHFKKIFAVLKEINSFRL